MPPKRTRGGGVKASSSGRKAPADASNVDASADNAQESESANAASAPSDLAAEAPSVEPVDASSSVREGGATEAATPATEPAASTTSVTRNPSVRGRGRGVGPAPQARRPFAPRTTTRRSQAERESLGASEAAKQAERERDLAARQDAERRKAERIQRTKQGWNNDRRGRGRGGYMGDRKPGVSGPFSQGTVEGKSKVFVPHSRSGAVRGQQKSGGVRTKAEGEGEGAGPSGSGRRTAGEGGDDGAMQDVKYEDGGYISSDDEEDAGPRKDVDTINLLSDDEEGAGRRERASSMRPVRLKRVEHRDRRVGVTIEAGAVDGDDGLDDDATVDGARAEPSRPAATSKGKGKTKSKDVEFVGENRVWQGTHRDDDGDTKPYIKEEPADEDTEMSMAPPELRPHSPERTKKSSRGKGRAGTSFLGGRKKPAGSTAEEEAEWDRYQQDLRTLVDELGDIDVGADGEANEDYERTKSERIYLFQFPPILPELRHTSADVKPEHEPPATAPSSPTLSKRAPTVAPKPDPEQAVKIEDDAPGTARNDGGPKMQAGALGKLRVHQSGKITLDYGGTSLQLNKGLDASFLQDAVITKLPAPGDVGAHGLAYALGPVRGKFVITPDFAAVVGGSHW